MRRDHHYSNRPRIIPYPPINQHGIVGDRRTAALVACDGTVDWLCLPDFDGGIVFGALLDWSKGGYWRLGPVRMALGTQRYEDGNIQLETRWELEEGVLVLEDVMLWPQCNRSPEQAHRRILVRTLRCERGRVRCRTDLEVRLDFHEVPVSVAESPLGFSLRLGQLSLRYSSEPAPATIGPRLHQAFELEEGAHYWAVLEAGVEGPAWSDEAVKAATSETRAYWRDWLGQIRSPVEADPGIRRTASMMHLLTYAPDGSVVAAPTTSLPERIGGGWNADYRFCWIRDASLSVGMLARLGVLQETAQYLQWLTRQLTRLGPPLQVLYGIRGETRPSQRKLSEPAGYRDSGPVRVGNHAYKQRQLGSYGYLADCICVYLQGGGEWRKEYWELTHRLAKYTLRHWRDPENGIWELPERRHFVSSKVLSWVTLERAIQIARQGKESFDTSEWEEACSQIHADVMEKGWSERLGAFRQHYDADTLDASALLISVFEFLPATHPRVLATLEKIAEFLGIDDFIFRFDPLDTPGQDPFPLGQSEGAFLPCTFWLATAYAKAGQLKRAQAVIQRVERSAGPLQLLSEAVDPRDGTSLGNFPLLFSHVEYVRAKLAIAEGLATKQESHSEPLSQTPDRS